MPQHLWHIAAATFLCMSGVIAQNSPSDDRELRKMQCFGVLVIAASGSRNPGQKFFEDPEYLEMIAECNATPESCRKTSDEIKEEGWPMPPGLSCGGHVSFSR
jgi:hypothetical protein